MTQLSFSLDTEYGLMTITSADLSVMKSYERDEEIKAFFSSVLSLKVESARLRESYEKIRTSPRSAEPEKPVSYTEPVLLEPVMVVS
jgi:hypothetical protein